MELSTIVTICPQNNRVFNFIWWRTRVTFYCQHIQKRALLDQTTREESALVTRIIIICCCKIWISMSKTIKTKKICLRIIDVASKMVRYCHMYCLRKAFSIGIFFFVFNTDGHYMIFYLRVRWYEREWIRMDREKERKKHIHLTMLFNIGPYRELNAWHTW